ncbi:MAG: N-acetylmuramoyl-L-alanine amidase [Clostridium sp.]
MLEEIRKVIVMKVSYSRILKVTNPLMYGEDVKAVQNKLNALGYNAGVADGYYGNGTADAVRRLQSKKGLSADGEVGQMTWEALFNTATNPGYSRILKVTNPLMYGEDVKAVQNKLNALGYNAGVADGYYGNGTADAVRRFQSKKGLSADGEVGQMTWEALFNIATNPGYSRILKVTNPLMYGEDVKAVQNKLNALGYNAGVVDGYYGNGTADAVRRFQSKKGLSADGEVGLMTWEALFNFAEGGGTDGELGGNLGDIKKVFIDPGHGGSDPGASGNGVIERDKVLEISMKLGTLLRARGIEVKYSRTSNGAYVGLSERAQMANSWGADIFVSIHANSFTSVSANGTETFLHTNGSNISRELARKINNSIVGKTGTNNRGVKVANFAVLRETNMPSVLVETAFVSNSDDANKLKSNPTGFAVAIAEGILNSSIMSVEKMLEDIKEMQREYGLTYNKELDKYTNTMQVPGLYITFIATTNVYRDHISTPSGGTQIYYKSGDLQIPDWAGSGIDFIGNYEKKTLGIAAKLFDNDKSKIYIKIMSDTSIKIEYHRVIGKNTVTWELGIYLKNDPNASPTDPPLLEAIKSLNGDVKVQTNSTLQFIVVGVIIGAIAYKTIPIAATIAFIKKGTVVSWGIAREVINEFPVTHPGLAN